MIASPSCRMLVGPRAGPCNNGKRHSWGEEQLVHKLVYWSVSHIPCIKCNRVKIIEYTKRGNHVSGYFTREAT